MNNLSFEDWKNYYEKHINNLYYIFRNNLNDIDKTCINNEDILYEKFVKFIYENSSKCKTSFNQWSDDYSDDYSDENYYNAENTYFKYFRLE